jgi:hypothetical protein
MCASDVTATLDQALAAAEVVHQVRAVRLGTPNKTK